MKLNPRGLTVLIKELLSLNSEGSLEVKARWVMMLEDITNGDGCLALFRLRLIMHVKFR